jgi:hypothetical protein
MTPRRMARHPAERLVHKISITRPRGHNHLACKHNDILPQLLGVLLDFSYDHANIGSSLTSLERTGKGGFELVRERVAENLRNADLASVLLSCPNGRNRGPKSDTWPR